MSDPEDLGASPRRSGPIPESRTTETAAKQREFMESRERRVIYQGGLSMRYQTGKWYKGSSPCLRHPRAPIYKMGERC